MLHNFEKKTEQSNSESLHRCFVQNLRLLSVGQIRTWLNYLQKRGGPRKRFQYCVDPHSADTMHAVPSSNSRPLCRETHQSYIARQRVVFERLRRAHLSRWKLPRYALDHSIWIDSWWQRRQERETCGVLYDRASNVDGSLSREGLRRDTVQDCSVQTQLEETPKHTVLV